MSIIESVYVEGFWGARTVKFDFHDDVNFLIGINGSGKTTVVNLVVAALTADLATLDRIDFSEIRIKLKTNINRKKPLILVKKKFSDTNPFPSIYFEVRTSISESPIIKFTSEDYEEVVLRGYRRHYRDRYHSLGEEMCVVLGKIVNISWLSVHRFNNDRNPRDEDRDESAVDKKLRELSNRLVRYFSTLGQQGAQLLEDFQKTVFLSMLHRKGNKPLFTTVRAMDIDMEKKALEAIFSSFKVKKNDFQNKLDGHFDALIKAREKLSTPVGLSTSDVSVLLGTERIDYIVDEWNRLISDRKKIFEPRDTYLQIINSMMQRKVFSINERNELEVTSQSGKYLPLTSLSSGEKQLLIVLGEALLQEKKSWVYIADEPELSLHVRWQESLVENLRAINPNSQIIFATHSPDVVSHFGNNIFDMELMLK